MSKALLKNLAAATLAATCAIGAQADNLRGFYAGGGIAVADGDVLGGSAEFRTIEAFGGYKYASWAGGEVRIGTGLSEEKINLGEDNNLELKIDHYESIYYRPELSNQTAKLYGLIGFSNIEVSNSAGVSASESGFSYGFGIGFVMEENLNLNFEYRIPLDKEDVEFTVMGISFDWRI